ncbi:MAG: hypothetical protein ACKO45_00390 [Cyanobium sp.]
MQLRVTILNKTYTLNPTRDYIVGIGEDCDLPLGGIDDAPTDYVRLTFDHEQAAWLALEISINCQMTVNNQKKPYCLIKAETLININNQFMIKVCPEGGSPSLPPSSNSSTSNKMKQPLAAKVPEEPAPLDVSEHQIPIINLGLRWFKISAPSDGVGIWLHPFDLYQTYSVERDHLGRICKKLYHRVHQAVANGSLRDAKVRLFNYRKARFLHEDIRKYLLVTRDTIHGNRTTIFMRFYGYGDNLYIGLDVFSIGRINWLTFLGRILLTFLLLPFIWAIIPALFIGLLWWKIIWRINYEKKIWLAMRQEHPGKIGIGPFDLDDIFMFSKSTLHLAVMTIREVFEEEGLPIESLDYFIQQINTGDSYTFDLGGGSVSNSTIAVGMKNRIGKAE